MSYYTGYFNLDTVLYSDINLTIPIENGPYSTYINVTQSSILSSPTISNQYYEFEVLDGIIVDIYQP